MGDNHGNVKSLDRVLRRTENEDFDYVVHVGDLTNAWFDGLQAGMEQLRSVESRLAQLEEQAREGLVYIYGNRDRTRDGGRGVYDEYEMDIGTRVPEEDFVSLSGQRFTQDPELVKDDEILITHAEFVPMLDHFRGQAYFSGHEHTGRYKDRCLNSAFLYRTDDHGGDSLYGSYFSISIGSDGGFDVDHRSIGRVEKIICKKHHERGVLFSPDFHKCQFCYDNQKQLMKEMTQSSFYGLTQDTKKEYVSEEELIEYAVDLFDTPPSDFDRLFTEHVRSLGRSPIDPVERDENGRLTRRR